MRNLIKWVMCMVMLMFSGVSTYAVGIVDKAISCAACSQRMCLIHNQFVENLKFGAEVPKVDEVVPPTPLPDKDKSGPDRKRPEPGVSPDVLKQFGVNKDGKLDEGERLALFKDRLEKNPKLKERLLAKFDLDKDGKFSEAELKAAQKQVEQHPPERRLPDGPIVSPSEPKPVPPVK
jgi:hypothetical protein